MERNECTTVGRFAARCQLKDGQGITTLLGRDPTADCDVVIKTTIAETISTRVRNRLTHEAELLGRSGEHPALEIGCQGDLLFCVRRFVPGVTLEERLRVSRLSIRDTLTVARGVLTTLERTHALDVFHRDLKPGNIIIDGESPLREVTLIDFGLARGQRFDSGGAAEPLQSIRYVSPEQAGILERGIDSRSDLYSVGVILFECLAGFAPFAGGTIGELLREHLTLRPPSLHGLREDVPRALDELVQRLLHKDPRDRYQSATAVLADIAALVEALDLGVADPSITIGASDLRKELTEPAFIGRESELKLFQEGLDRVRRGESELILVESDSGGGKSRLCEEMMRISAQRDAFILRGQARQLVAARPLQMLEGVVRTLLIAVENDPELAERLRRELVEWRDQLIVALPELAPLFGALPTKAHAPEAYGESLTLTALGALLDALGSVDRPAVLLLDDCQWADEMTVKLIARRKSAPRCHVLLVVAFRSEEVPTGHPLRALGGATHLVLAQLSSSEVRQQLESMAGPLPTEVIDVVGHLSAGNPFMVWAVLQGLVETGALVHTAGGWHVEAIALAQARSSSRAAPLLLRGLDLLAPSTSALLSVGALLGKQFDVDLARSLAQQTADEVSAGLTEAQRKHLAWTNADGTRATFVHDRIREALLNRILEEERRRIHRAVAEKIERAPGEHPERVFELAYHFDAAGESRKALEPALLAAEQARAQHALEVAEHHYRIAEKAKDAAASTCARIAEGLGDVLMLRGRYAEAEERLEAARALADTERARAVIEGKLGNLALKHGKMVPAMHLLEQALTRLGHPAPRNTFFAALRALFEIFIQTLHSLLPRVFLARRPFDLQADNDLLAARIYSRLATVYWFHKSLPWAFWAHLRELNLSERYPPTSELAQAYSNHGPGMTSIPWYSRGKDYAQRSIAIRKQLGDQWGLGQSLHYYCVVLYAASELEACVQACDEAVRLLDRMGDMWEANDAAINGALALHRLGDLAGAVEQARRVYDKGIEIGDTHSTGHSLEVMAKATGGKVAAELLRAELEHSPDDAITYQSVLQGEALRLAGDGHLSEAVAALERAQHMVREAGIRNEYVMPIQPMMATLLRQMAEATSPRDPVTRDALLRRAEKAATRGLHLARAFRNNLPHALRERGLLHALRGRQEVARRMLDESLAVAAKQGARFEQAQTELALAELGVVHGWPQAEASLRRAQAALKSPSDLSTFGRSEPARQPSTDSVTLSLVDRFSTLLDVGRHLASALTREEVFAAVQEASLSLLRAETCVVLTASGDSEQPKFTVVAGDATARYSASLCQRALAGGRPVVATESEHDESVDGRTVFDQGSGLCAPFLVRARPAGCIYVTHEHVSGLFGEEEDRLARFIATLAGAALENAEGYSKVQEALRARELFMMVASHELKTPLTSLQLRMQLFEKRQRSRSDVGAGIIEFESVQPQIQRLHEVIGEMLDFSAISSGTLSLKMATVDLGDAVGRVARRFEKKLAAAGSQLELEIASGVRGRWDLERVEQVIVTLLSNAIKFGAGKPIRLAVEKRDGEAWLTVRDQGIGIPAESLARIFDRFEQAVEAKNYGGLGLGLWIVRHILEALGGRIQVASRPGEGAEFAIALPLGPTA